MIPHNFFIFRASEMTFPVFSWGKVYKSEHQKTLTIQHRNINKIIYIYNFFFQIFEVSPCCGHQVQSDWHLIGGIFILNLDKTVN